MIADDIAWLTANTHFWSLEVNEQRACYRSVADELELDYERLISWTSPESRAACLAGAPFIQIRVYPDTPVGSYLVASDDVAVAVRYAREVVEEDRR